jgi:transcriptional antiterminator Rof (Rho-off)
MHFANDERDISNALVLHHQLQGNAKDRERERERQEWVLVDVTDKARELDLGRVAGPRTHPSQHRLAHIARVALTRRG